MSSSSSAYESRRRSKKMCDLVILELNLHLLHHGLESTLVEGFMGMDCLRYPFQSFPYSVGCKLCCTLFFLKFLLFFQVDGKRCCKLFLWYDDEVSARVKKVIAGLRRKIKEMRKKEILLIFCLSISIVLVILLLIGYVTKQGNSSLGFCL